MALVDQIAEWLEDFKRIAILGIGNPLRRDDAVGTEIVKMLKGNVPKNTKIIDCQTIPENFISEIKRFNPTHILLVDAVQLDDEPGKIIFVPPERISALNLFTHTMPLYLLSELLKKRMNVKIMLLGVQPKSIEFGGGMTPELKSASKEIASILIKMLKGNPSERTSTTAI